MKKIICLLFFVFLLPMSAYGADDLNVGVIEEHIPQAPKQEVVVVEVEETTIDESTKMVTSKYFDLTLEKKPQSAFGKYIPYVITIIPHIDSPKTQILWNMPSTLEVKTKHSEFVNLKEGETYEYKANVKALREGSYEFSVSVIAWQYNTNYTNSIYDKLEFDDSLILQPVSTEYVLFNVMKYVLIVVAFVGVCYLVIRLSKKFGKKMKDWLTPPF